VHSIECMDVYNSTIVAIVILRSRNLPQVTSPTRRKLHVVSSQRYMLRHFVSLKFQERMRQQCAKQQDTSLEKLSQSHRLGKGKSEVRFLVGQDQQGQSLCFEFGSVTKAVQGLTADDTSYSKSLTPARWQQHCGGVSVWLL
jgi:hypothetical protein